MSSCRTLQHHPMCSTGTTSPSHSACWQKSVCFPGWVSRAVWNIHTCTRSPIRIPASWTSGSILSAFLSGSMLESGQTLLLNSMLRLEAKLKSASRQSWGRYNVMSAESNWLLRWQGVYNTGCGRAHIFISNPSCLGI